MASLSAYVNIVGAALIGLLVVTFTAANVFFTVVELGNAGICMTLRSSVKTTTVSLLSR